MKNKEIKKLNKNEAKNKINSLKKDLFNFRFRKTSEQLADTAWITFQSQLSSQKPGPWPAAREPPTSLCPILIEPKSYSASRGPRAPEIYGTTGCTKTRNLRFTCGLLTS